MAYRFNSKDATTYGMVQRRKGQASFQSTLDQLLKSHEAFRQTPPFGFNVGPSSLIFTETQLKKLVKPFRRKAKPAQIVIEPEGIRIYFGYDSAAQQLCFVACGATTLPDQHDFPQRVWLSLNGTSWQKIQAEAARPYLHFFRDKSPRAYFLGTKLLQELHQRSMPRLVDSVTLPAPSSKSVIRLTLFSKRKNLQSMPQFGLAWLPKGTLSNTFYFTDSITNSTMVTAKTTATK
ncbi:MAG: hypothetical protein H7Y12_06690, partial [Sphingobacteriaceae bacterium]|nr:hypothetical protein [Cytophagaceae bacterium]